MTSPNESHAIRDDVTFPAKSSEREILGSRLASRHSVHTIQFCAREHYCVVWKMGIIVVTTQRSPKVVTTI